MPLEVHVSTERRVAPQLFLDYFYIAMVLNTFYVGVDNSWEMATRSEQKSLIIRSGMDVYLHEADTMPDFNQIPDELNVGYLKYIAYNQVSKIRYPVNNRCFQDPAPIVVRGFQTGETKSYKFSRSLCIETQKADEVYRRCNCRSEILLISERVPDDTVFCHRIDDTLHTLYNASVAMGVFLRQSSMIPIVAKMRKRYECHQNTLNELRTETFPLHCVPSCVEHKYEYDKSVLVILRQSVQYNEIYNESMQLIISRFNETQRYRTAKMLQFISSSGLRYDLRYFISLISLVPKTLSVDTVEESLSYPLGSYFSDMGGVLGLYIGFSAITVLEIFELFIQHFSNKLCRGRTANA